MGLGDPSPKELTCLANLRQWEQGLEFDRELRGGGGVALKAVECTGYGRRLTPWQCLENQLSLYCLPGWPCETCEEAVGIVVKGKSSYCVHLNTQVHQGLCVAARAEARRRQEAWPEGLGWLENCLGCNNNFKVGRPGRDLALQEASVDPQSGTPALNIAKKKPKRLPAWWENASRAVRRDWLRETG